MLSIVKDAATVYELGILKALLRFCGGHIIPFAEGVQQDDPLGPLFFCL